MLLVVGLLPLLVIRLVVARLGNRRLAVAGDSIPLFIGSGSISVARIGRVRGKIRGLLQRAAIDGRSRAGGGVVARLRSL